MESILSRDANKQTELHCNKMKQTDAISTTRDLSIRTKHFILNIVGTISTKFLTKVYLF